MRWHELQPKNGEVVITCSHIDPVHAPHHFFNLPRGLAVRDRAGVLLAKSQWLCVCQDCFDTSGRERLNPLKVARGWGKWSGDEPVIVKPPLGEQ